MDAPSPKRPCLVRLATSSVEIPSSLPVPPGFNQSNIDTVISSFLSLSDLPLFPSPLSIGCSFDRVLDKVIPTAAGTYSDEVDKDRFLDRTLQLASLLHKSTKRCIRKRATLHNSVYWPLPPELTIKVFSMLDTKSLMQASACCSMFNKFAMDPVCYSHIDLTMGASYVDNGVVCIMIHRAGKELRSIKLSFCNTSLLTRTCLTPLTFNHGFAGGLLRSLHLYHLSMMDSESLSPVFSACLNLTNLKIVGLVSEARFNTLEELVSLTRNCRSIEKLFIQNFCGGNGAGSPLIEFLDNFPNLVSLSLICVLQNNTETQNLIKGFGQLKHINLSNSLGISGFLLRGLVLSCRESPLETLILRNCTDLKESEVLLFLNSLIAGDFKSIRFIDVSSVLGLVSDQGSRSFEPIFPTEELANQRPNVTFVAIYERPSSSSSSSSSSGSYSDSSSSSGGSLGSDKNEEEYWSNEEVEEEVEAELEEVEADLDEVVNSLT